LDGGAVELLTKGAVAGLAVKDSWLGAGGEAAVETIVGEIIHVGGDGNEQSAWCGTTMNKILCDVVLDDVVDRTRIGATVHN
jgi:hypothetical protein